MEVSKTTEAKVGIMIGAGLALFMITTLLLGGGKKYFTAFYTLRVQFENVAGVSPGSVVQVLGIPVGNVSRIYFVPDKTALEVELSIEKDYQFRITKGSLAGVRTQGALGDKFIYITPGPEAGPAMADGEVLTTELGGDLFSTLASKGDQVEQMFDVITELRKLLINLNADGKSAQLMPNLVRSSDEMANALASLNGVLGDLRGGKSGDSSSLKNSIAHLESVLKKLDRGQGTLGALVNDPEIHERIRSALGGTSQGQFLKNQVRETIRSE